MRDRFVLIPEDKGKHSVHPIQTDPLTGEETENLFSNGLKSPPTPNAHSASGRGFHFQGASLSIPTHRRKEVRGQALCLFAPSWHLSGSGVLNVCQQRFKPRSSFRQEQDSLAETILSHSPAKVTTRQGEGRPGRDTDGVPKRKRRIAIGIRDASPAIQYNRASHLHLKAWRPL